MRTPKDGTYIPDTVIFKREGTTFEIDSDIKRALIVAIAEDFMDLTPMGMLDIVSAAHEARTTLEVLRAAGLKAVPLEEGN